MQSWLFSFQKISFSNPIRRFLYHNTTVALGPGYLTSIWGDGFVQIGFKTLDSWKVISLFVFVLPLWNDLRGDAKA